MSVVGREVEAGGVGAGIACGGIASWISRVSERVHRRLAARLTRRRLVHLDERLLEDIGIDPAEMRGGSGEVGGVADALMRLMGGSGGF